MISPDVSIRSAAALMRQEDIELLVVGAERRLLGVVTARDLAFRCVATALDPRNSPVRSAMTLGVPTCSPTDSLHEALERMRRMQSTWLIVRNEDCEIVGTISILHVLDATVLDHSEHRR